MKKSRILVAAGLVALGSLAMAAEQVPSWLVGKYTGYSSYMKCNFDLTVSSNGLVFASTKIGDKEMYHCNGEYKHKALILGKKIYGIDKRSYGIEIVNEGNPKDTVDLKRG